METHTKLAILSLASSMLTLAVVALLYGSLIAQKPNAVIAKKDRDANLFSVHPDPLMSYAAESEVFSCLNGREVHLQAVLATIQATYTGKDCSR